MSEKRMLIVDAELAKRIEENRGDMSYSDFINFLIDKQLKGEGKDQDDIVTREEFHQFQEGAKELLRSFLDFFINYGLELGKQPKDEEFDQLTRKIRALSNARK